jgi:hypothetical protein
MSAIATAKTSRQSGFNERLTRLGRLREPAGYVDGQNLYEYVQSDPVGNVDPDGLQTRPAGGPRSRPTTRPIASPGEKVVSDVSFGSWQFPYTCNVPGAGSGLGNYGAMIEKFAGKVGAEAFARALSLAPEDLYEYGYSAIAEIRKAHVRRDSDSCERDVIYIDVKEFIAVPLWKDLYDWEKKHIEQTQIALQKYPRDKPVKLPNPAPGLQEWTRIREIVNKVDGDTSQLSGTDLAEMGRLSQARSKNFIRVILLETPWTKPAGAGRPAK